VASHHQTVESDLIIKEVSLQSSLSEGTVVNVMSGLAEVIGRHLRCGDKVRLPGLGMLKQRLK
jgi:nucleoid DNA-binding protein